MTDAKFEKVSESDQPLYGPRKLLLCGFSAEAQPKFDTLLEAIGLPDIPKVWVTDEQAGTPVGELAGLAAGTGAGRSSSLPRAVIMAGITQNELHRLMGGCRQAQMKPALWATLTPTSENWALKDLLKELRAEQQAMQEQKK